MNKFKTFLVFLVTFILQTTIFSKIDIFGANINIMIPAVIAMSQILGRKIGPYGSMITGLFEDFLFTSLIGPRALSYFLIGSFVSSDRFNFAKDKTTGIIMTFLASIFNFLLLSLIYYIFIRANNFTNYFPLPLLVESVLNSLIYLIYYRLIKKIMYIPTYRI